MCDSGKWTPEQFCGPKGLCVNSSCICVDGWGHDISLFREYNCWLPPYAMNVVELVVGLLTLIVCILAIKDTFRLRSYARLFMSLTAISMLCTTGYALAHHLEGATHGPASIILLTAAILCAANGIHLALYQMLKPFWKLSGKGRLFKGTVIGIQAMQTVSMTVCAFVLIAFMDDDNTFNLIMTVYVCILGFHFAALWIFLTVSTTSVINTVEKTAVVMRSKSVTSAPTGDVSPREKRVSVLSIVFKTSSQNLDKATSEKVLMNAKAKQLVTKIRRYRKYGRLVGPVVIISIFVGCLLKWVMGSIPLMWLIYAISLVHFPIFGLVQLLLVKSSANEPDAGSSRTIPGSPQVGTPLLKSPQYSEL